MFFNNKVIYLQTILFNYVVTIKEENMKKINLFKKGCCIFLLFVLVFTGAVIPASANDYEESNAFYVTANQVPNEVINYAVDNAYNFLVCPMAAASKNLSLDMLETQGSQSWCAAFAMSSILRYKGAGNSVTAKAIMKDTFPKSKDLENESISRSQLVSYAKGKGYKKTKKSSSTLSNSTVVSEISTNSTPIYAGCDGTGTYKKARHALVISGYDNNKSTYTVWNPWYSYTETIDQSSKKYKVDSSSSFLWDVTIYKVRK